LKVRAIKTRAATLKNVVLIQRNLSLTIHYRKKTSHNQTSIILYSIQARKLFGLAKNI